MPANGLESVGNTPSNTYTVSVDLVRPSVVISDVPTTANAPFEVTITFSEDVTGFAAGRYFADRQCDCGSDGQVVAITPPKSPPPLTVRLLFKCQRMSQ